MIFDKITHPEPEEFLAINIFEKSCSFATFTLDSSEVDVKNFTNYFFSQDENLTEITKQFLEKNKIKTAVKVVFGLPSFWIEEEKVRPEFEKLLLSLTAALKLTPFAFVSNILAFAFYKHWRDQVLGNFYVLGVFRSKIEAVKLENGEVKKLVVEDYQDLNSFDFSKIFEQSFPSKVFVFAEDSSENIKNILNQFFSNQEGQKPEILGVDKFELSESLSKAAAFDLGKIHFEPAKVQPQEFGFIKGEDVGAIEKKDRRESAVFEKETPKKEFPKLKIFQTFLKFLQSLLYAFPKFGGKKISFAIVTVLVIIIAIFAIFWFSPKADVEILVKSASFSQDFEITANPTADFPDSQTLVIPAQVLSTEKTGSKKTVTSGKKKIGEKATGTMTVFNKTAAFKTFPVGTVIVGPENIKFILTESVAVASRSATLEGIIFGKNKVKVKAVEIGEVGNLSAGVNFSFTDFDSSLYSAHAESDFAGGSQKEINIVSQEDRERLLEELTKELKEAAKTELISQNPEKQIDPQAILAKPVELKFDKEVESEANILTLTGKFNFTVTVFQAQDLEKVIFGKLKEQIPSGFASWQNEKITTSISKTESDDVTRIKVNFTADLIPEVDKEEIIETISGKSVEFTKNYLLSLPDVEGANIQISPKLPGFLGNLPRSKLKIKVEVKGRK